VQELQRDASARGVHRPRDHAMAVAIRRRRDLRAVRTELAGIVRRKPPRDKQRGAAARALGIERGEPLHAVGPRLEPGVHRAHENAVRQPHRTQIQRPKQMWIRKHWFGVRVKGVRVNLL